jgi:hypothetical protein
MVQFVLVDENFPGYPSGDRVVPGHLPLGRKGFSSSRPSSFRKKGFL